MKKFSLHEPQLKGNEKLNVKQCLDTGWLSSSGNFVSKFEKKLEIFAEMVVLASVMFIAAFFCFRVLLFPKASPGAIDKIYEVEEALSERR